MVSMSGGRGAQKQEREFYVSEAVVYGVIKGSRLLGAVRAVQPSQH